MTFLGYIVNNRVHALHLIDTPRWPGTEAGGAGGVGRAQMQISARADYAIRALCVLTGAREGCAVKADDIAAAQGIPRTFLDSILVELRRAGMIESRRGPEGGHRLARPAHSISLADVVRVTDGPLALVRGQRPENLAYEGAAEHLRDVWVAVRASLRSILELTTLAQVVAGELPEGVIAHTSQDRSWQSVWPPVTT
ncbi:MAG: RrF2 family transcriptional regulator [Pseudonocardia sp.]